MGMSMPTMRAIRVFGLLAIVAAVSDCGDYVAPPAYHTWTVAVGDAGFDPGEVDVSPGQHVRWEWAPLSVNQHNVTFEDARVQSSVTQASGSFDIGFDAVGIYFYRCTIHPEMTGRVRVISNLQPPFLP